MFLSTPKKILIKNSYAWFKSQKHKPYINATEVSSIMGLNPYEKALDVLHKKLFGKKFVTNEAIEYGKRMEPQANWFFSSKAGINYPTKIFVKDIYLAILDGYDETSQTLLEIKCPLRPQTTTWQNFFEAAIIPPYYYAQMQCQLYVSEATKGYFFVYVSPNYYKIKTVYQEPAFINKMHQETKDFKQLLHEAKQAMKN